MPHNCARVNFTKDSAAQTSHCLGVTLTPDRGRLLICVLCWICFPFPQGERYAAVWRQFDTHECNPDEPLLCDSAGKARKGASTVYPRSQILMPEHHALLGREDRCGLQSAGTTNPALAGKKLRMLREELGLTMRDVESASQQIARRHQNDQFCIAPSRLSDIETKGVVPSFYRLYSLATIYRWDLRELLVWYGVDLNLVAADMHFISPPKSHVSEALAGLSAVRMPVRLDPAFDPRQTANFGRMVEAWGLVPLAHLAQLASCQYTYGYIGGEDFTMYPILLPGSFIQVDKSKNTVEEKPWRSDYERPIYLVWTRQGLVACWCTVKSGEIVLTPHPLSSVAPRTLRYPQEAEVIGQVVGAAVRLGGWRRTFEPSSGLEDADDTGARDVRKARVSFH